ncbi:interleukin-17 receptor E-like protein isoform X2 [Amia ocellicauda]|uniref:interleukin-17 receptor E-like protein isoform X2 n=1 Tax=Amia ocellicauda TaxID=2972642 RepID=UPI003464C60C
MFKTRSSLQQSSHYFIHTQLKLWTLADNTLVSHRIDLHWATFFERVLTMKIIALIALFFCSSVLAWDKIDRIQECGHECSEGLLCKTKPHSSFSFCQKLPAFITGPVFQSVDISTVMKCERKQKCSLHLKINARLQFNENIRGVKMCFTSAGAIEQCKVIKFSKDSNKEFKEQQLQVQYNCFEVGIGQQIYVTLQTVPYYCNLTWSQLYHVPDCSHEDIRKDVPICIAGKLDYIVDTERKMLSVEVSELLKDRDYNMRLCHKWHSCESTGAYTLIRSEDPMKNATLPYSRLLPCLCIEGWSSIEDASRTQLCPFKNRTEELWSGINYNAEAQELSWEPACPTDVKINLCWRAEENLCSNFANTSKKAQRSKVKYTQVEPNPRMCMKFTTETGSWIKCPFTYYHVPDVGPNTAPSDSTPMWMVALSLSTVTVVIVVALVGHVMLTVFQRRNRKRKSDRQQLTHKPNLPLQPDVTVLFSADDGVHTSLVKAFEQYLKDLHFSVTLINLDHTFEKQKFCLDTLNVTVILVWSNGCAKHLNRLVRNNGNILPRAKECLHSALIKVDIVTCIGNTAHITLPSQFNVIPLSRVKEIFAMISFPNAAALLDLLFSVEDYRSKQILTHLEGSLSELENTSTECTCDETSLLGNASVMRK